jgi:hypothetical protein
MDQAGKTFTSEGPDSRKWIGRIIIAVILGEAIWSLIIGHEQPGRAMAGRRDGAIFAIADLFHPAAL